jgi:hypothetical protein
MLPADLAGADPTNGTWSHAMVVGIAYPGASYAGLIPTVDRVWQTWGGPVAGGYVTSDNFSVTQNFYDAGLGPP